MLQVNKVRKSYNGREVLKGVDLSIRNSEYVAMIGRSGSGKTTLVRAVNGFVIPDAGTIKVKGRTDQLSQQRRAPAGPQAHRHDLPAVQPGGALVGPRQRALRCPGPERRRARSPLFFLGYFSRDEQGKGLSSC